MTCTHLPPPHSHCLIPTTMGAVQEPPPASECWPLAAPALECWSMESTDLGVLAHGISSSGNAGYQLWECWPMAAPPAPCAHRCAVLAGSTWPFLMWESSRQDLGRGKGIYIPSHSRCGESFGRSGGRAGRAGRAGAACSSVSGCTHLPGTLPTKLTAAHFSNPHCFPRMRSKIKQGGYSSNVFLDLEKATACYRLPAGLPLVKATQRAAAHISISELFTEFCPSLRHFPSQY